VLNLSAVQRLIICLALAALATWLSSYYGIEIWTSLMIGWDVFSFFMIALGWIIFLKSSTSVTAKLAKREDESRTIIFTIVLVSVLISLFGILVLLKHSARIPVRQGLHEPVSMLGVALSWLMLHTIFALHYTHLYYGEGGANTAMKEKPLDFPGNEPPDYLDFAYFSFVIGMTFQVSDVTIPGRSIRRLVLLHALISFLFNTVILALMISILSNLGR
jgi:uncharacterized membrane protein